MHDIQISYWFWPILEISLFIVSAQRGLVCNGTLTSTYIFLIFGVPSFFLTYRHFSHVAGTLPLRVRAGDCQMAQGQCERHSGQLTELSFA